MTKRFSYTFQRRPSVNWEPYPFCRSVSTLISPSMGKKKSSRAAFLFLLFYLNSRKNWKCTKPWRGKKQQKPALYPLIPNDAIPRKKTKQTKPSIATGRSNGSLSELSRRAASLRLDCCISGRGERGGRQGEVRGRESSGAFRVAGVGDGGGAKVTSLLARMSSDFGKEQNEPLIL